MKDVKLILIIVLCLIIVGMFSWIIYGEFQKDKQEIYLRGVNDGRVLEQRNVWNSVQTTGFYTLNIVQGDQQATLILKPVQTQQ